MHQSVQRMFKGANAKVWSVIISIAVFFLAVGWFFLVSLWMNAAVHGFSDSWNRIFSLSNAKVVLTEYTVIGLILLAAYVVMTVFKKLTKRKRNIDA